MTELRLRTEQIPEKLTRDELRELFLFEKLDDEQLDWLVRHGDVVEASAGETVCREGEPADVLLRAALGRDGDAAPGARRRGRDHPHRASAASTAARPRPTSANAEQTYMHSLRATRRDVPRAARRRVRRRRCASGSRWPIHLLEGLVRRHAQHRRRSPASASGCSRSARCPPGLTHELNNPAAAAVRATASLRSRVAGMRHKLGHAGLRQARRRDDRPARRPAGGRRQRAATRPGPAR